MYKVKPIPENDAQDNIAFCDIFIRVYGARVPQISSKSIL